MKQAAQSLAGTLHHGNSHLGGVSEGEPVQELAEIITAGILVSERMTESEEEVQQKTGDCRQETRDTRQYGSHFETKPRLEVWSNVNYFNHPLAQAQVVER